MDELRKHPEFCVETKSPFDGPYKHPFRPETPLCSKHMFPVRMPHTAVCVCTGLALNCTPALGAMAAVQHQVEVGWEEQFLSEVCLRPRPAEGSGPSAGLGLDMSGPLLVGVRVPVRVWLWPFAMAGPLPIRVKGRVWIP